MEMMRVVKMVGKNMSIPMERIGKVTHKKGFYHIWIKELTNEAQYTVTDTATITFDWAEHRLIFTY